MSFFKFLGVISLFIAFLNIIVIPLILSPLQQQFGLDEKQARSNNMVLIVSGFLFVGTAVFFFIK